MKKDNRKFTIAISNSARGWGGNESWTATCANSLVECGHRVFLLHRTDIFHNRLSKKVVSIKLPFRHEFDRKTSKAIFELIRKEDIDILLPTKRKEYVLLGKIGKKLDIPTIFRLGIVRKINAMDIYQRRIYQYLADGIIVNADAIKRQLIADKIVKNPAKVHVVYNGYDFTPLRETELPIELPQGKYLFAAAGRLTEQKGFDILIESTAQLAHKRRDFAIFIAGSGGDEPLLRKMAREMAIEDIIHFIGNIDYVRKLFASAECVLMPSRREGVANTLFEAWSVEKPVIASDSSGFPEVIDHGKDSFMFRMFTENPNYFANLSTAMEFAIENDLYQIGRNGKTKLENNFSIDRMSMSIEKILQSYIKKAGLY